MKECQICNFTLIAEEDNFCAGCIRENKLLDRKVILRLRKKVKNIFKEFYMKKKLENIKLINQIET